MRETGFEPVSPETVVLKTTGITELTDSRNRCFVILRFWLLQYVSAPCTAHEYL